MILYLQRILFIGLALGVSCAQASSCKEYFVNWKDQYVLLRERVKNADEIIKGLSVNASNVLEVISDIGGYGDKGANPGGVFLVRTQAGLKAMKIVPKAWDELVDPISTGATNRQRDEVILQNFLAEQGLSIPITGVLSMGEFTNLFRKFPELKTNLRKSYPDAKWSAFLMDYVPNAWNPKKNGTTAEISNPPSHFIKWNILDLRKQVSQISRIRDLLGIHSRDLQILISEDGKVYAIDFGLETILYRGDLSGDRFQPPNSHDVSSTENSYQEKIRLIEERRK